MKELLQRIVYFGVSFVSRYYLSLCLFVLLASLFATAVVRYRFIFMLTPDLSGVENYNTYWIHRFMAGFPLYEDPEKPPFGINAYTPLYFYVVVGIGRLLRVSPDDVQGVYVLGRAVSLLANVLFAGMLFRIGTRVFRLNAVLAFLAAALSFLLLYLHCYAVRPDALYNFMLISSLYAFMRFLVAENPTGRWGYLMGSAAVAVLALYTKQSAFFLPVLIGGFILVFMNRAVRVTGFLLFVGAYAVSFLLALWLMGGNDYGIFFKNVVSGLNNGISIKWLIWFVLPELHLFLPLFVTGLIVGITYAMDERPAYCFLGWTLLALFVTSTGTLLKFGSHVNYYTEFFGLSLIGSMLFWREFDQRKGQTATGRLTFFAVIGFLCLFQVGLLAQYNYIRYGPMYTSPYESERAVASYVQDSLTIDAARHVFIYQDEHTYLNSMLYRRIILPQNGIITLYPSLPYSLQNVRDYVAGGGVQYVIAPHQQFTPKNSLYESVVPTRLFQFRRTVSGHDIFEYAPAARTGAAVDADSSR